MNENEIILIKETELHQIEQEIRQLKGNIALSILEIGDRLIKVKEAMPHGMFLSWVENTIDLSQRSANNYMRASRTFDTMEKRKAISNFTATKVLMLAELPDSTRDDFIESVDVDGMTTRELKEAVQKEKSSADVRKYFARSIEERDRYFEIEISKLKPLPEYEKYGVDPRTGKDYIRFLNGLEECGMFEAIFITKNNIILNGHERVRAMRDLGHKTITARYWYVNDFREGETLQEVCLRSFFDLNRWDFTRTSLYYYFSGMWYFTLWNFEEGERMFDIFKNQGDEIDKRYQEQCDRIERLMNSKVPVQEFYDSGLPLEDYLLKIGA